MLSSISCSVEMFTALPVCVASVRRGNAENLCGVGHVWHDGTSRVHVTGRMILRHSSTSGHQGIGARRGCDVMPRTQCLESAAHVLPLSLRLKDADTTTARDAQWQSRAENLRSLTGDWPCEVHRGASDLALRLFQTQWVCRLLASSTSGVCWQR